MLLDKKAAFGLANLSDEAIRKVALNAKDKFPAHWGTYADEQLPNGLKIIHHVTPLRWNEEAVPTEVRYVQPNFSFDVNTDMSFVIDNNQPIKPIHDSQCIWMRALTDNREYGQVIPVKVVHPWLLPSFISIEQVSLKVFVLADQIRILRPGKLDDQSQVVHIPHEFISLKSILGKYCTEEKKDCINLLAEIIDNRSIPAAKLPQLTGTPDEAFTTEPMRLLTCKTPFGNVSVLTRESLLSDKSKELLNSPGMIVSVSGLLIGDARTGEFSKGMRWDELILGQLLRSSAYTHSIRLISKYLRRDSIILVDGKMKAYGIEAILKVMRPLVYDKYEINYCGIRDVKTGKPHFALVFRDKTDRRFMHWLIPSLAKDGAWIAGFRIETRFNRFEIVLEGNDLEYMKDHAVGKFKAYSGQKKSETETDENDKFIFDGDADVFPSKHEEDMDGVLSALCETEEEFKELLGPVIESAGVILDSQKQIAGEEILILNSSPSWGQQQMAFYIAKDPVEKKALLKMQIPKYEGLTCKAKVLSICTWPNKIGGEVALAIGETLITAVVPDFYLKKELLVPGKELYFRISASAQKLDKQPVKSFTITEGALYEAELSRFLKENPNKTEKDFPGVKISTEGMTALLPRGYSTFFELASPVLAIESTTFLGEKILKMKVILHRFEDEEIYMNLYAAPNQIALDENIGSVVGLVRLYAEPLEVQIN